MKTMHFSLLRSQDWIFYGVPGDEYHTGGVVEVSGKTVYTIEGNVDNQVLLLAHDINDPSIAGYGRPKYQKNDPCNIYVVKPNDTLNKIADMFDVKAEDIAKENNIADPNLINVGQVLIFKKARKSGIRPISSVGLEIATRRYLCSRDFF